jgi:exodeoxyribonuclease VII small subunit
VEDYSIMANTDLKDLDFENAYQELEGIVERMERGEQELEKSLADFERGVSLMKHCHSKLKDAEQKVDILVKDNDGLFSTEPFEDKT